jgi:hypothetical protein
MLRKYNYIKKIDITTSKVNEKELKNLTKIEYGAFIIKVIGALIFLGVGIFLVLKDIQYADAQINFKIPGIEVNCNRIIPGVLCLLFAFILFCIARINITVKQSK